MIAYAEILRRLAHRLSFLGAPFAASYGGGKYLPLWTKITCPGSHHHEPAPCKSPRRTSPFNLASMQSMEIKEQKKELPFFCL